MNLLGNQNDRTERLRTTFFRRKVPQKITQGRVWFISLQNNEKRTFANHVGMFGVWYIHLERAFGAASVEHTHHHVASLLHVILLTGHLDVRICVKSRHEKLILATKARVPRDARIRFLVWRIAGWTSRHKRTK